MKNLNVLLIICLISCKSNLESSRITEEYNPGVHLYANISKIDSIANYYLIYIEDNNNLFKVVSEKKDSNELVTNRIETGNSYNFRINQITDRRQTKSSNIPVPINYLEIARCVKFGATEICTESSYELATAYNLSGLSLLKN